LIRATTALSPGCIKAITSKVLKATWQRCRVHFMRNALAHAGKTAPGTPSRFWLCPSHPSDVAA
jgi:hypothetical protein